MDKEQIATSPWREAVVMLAKSFREYFKDRTSAFLTAGGKLISPKVQPDLLDSFLLLREEPEPM